MDNKIKDRGFGSRIGYILSMAGFCIGVGNMWKFPYMVGANGGGAFLLCYIAMAIFVGIPLFLIEVQLGRSSQLSGISGMQKLTGKKGSFWNSIGWLGTVSGFIIGVYCLPLVGGWVLGYIFKIAGGSLRGMNNEQVIKAFADYSGSWNCVALTAVYAFFVWLIMNTGVKRGVEKLCKIAMPTLIVLLIGLAIYSNTLPGSRKGLLWYLTPDFSAITFNVLQAAAVQVFFSIGIGMCCGFVYGSYIKKDANMVGDTAGVAMLDTFVAILSGLVITPALFAFNIEPTSGSSLIFITLPQMFNAMSPVAGTLFGVLFLIAIFLAGTTTVVGFFEAVQTNLMDTLGWGRKKADLVTTVAAFVFALPATLSVGTGALSEVRLFGYGIFDFYDVISSAFGLTIGAVLMLLFVLFKWRFENFRREANLGAGRRIYIWVPMSTYYKFILPLLLALVVYGIIAAYFFG